MSRLNRAVLTVAAGIGGSTLATLVGFFTTPIALRYLGDGRYGAFRAATDWFGYVGLLEIGVSGALLAVFSKALGTGHRPGVAAGARAGLRAYLIVVLLMLATAAVLGSVMPGLIRAPDDLVDELRVGCRIYLIGYLVLPLAIFRPLAESEQRGYVVQMMSTAQLLTVMFLSVGLAATGWGLIGQFIGLVAGSVLFHLLLVWDGLRKHPEVIHGPVAAQPAIWSLSWPTFLLHLSGRLGLFTDNILLAAFLGPAAVTPFVLTQRLIQAAGSQVIGVGTAGWAGLVDLYYRGETDVFVVRLTQLTRLTGIVASALLTPIAVWNRDLIVLWVGADQYAGPAVTWLAAGNAWGQAIFNLWGWMLAGTGRVRASLPAQLVGVTVNLAASAAATAAFGQVGPLLGTSIVFAGLTWWWMLLLLRRELGVSATDLFWAAARPALVAVALGGVLILLAGKIPAYDPAWPGWMKWTALAGWLSGAACLYLALAWSLVLPAAERADWVNRFRRWIRRPPARDAGSG
jgi:O-antigen/teichoic acid export membrane protein